MTSFGLAAEDVRAQIPSQFDSLSVTGADGRTRIPFVFSSTKRALASKDDDAIAGYVQDILGSFQGETLNSGELSQTAQLISDAFAAAANTVNASVFSRPVTMLINPSSVRAEMPKRIAKLDTLRGSVFVHFTDEFGFDNDVMTLSFSGSTGTLTAPAGSSDDEVRRCFLRRLAWLNLWALTLEEAYLPNARLANIKSATIATPSLPLPLSFDGHFPAMLSFEESADNRNDATYSFSFVVSSVRGGGTNPTGMLLDYLALEANT